MLAHVYHGHALSAVLSVGSPQCKVASHAQVHIYGLTGVAGTEPQLNPTDLCVVLEAVDIAKVCRLARHKAAES